MDAPEHGQPLEPPLLHVSGPEPDSSLCTVLELQADLRRQEANLRRREVRGSKIQAQLTGDLEMDNMEMPHR